LRPPDSVVRPFKRQKPRGSLVLPGATLHLLDEVHEKVSATQIRNAARLGGTLTRYVSPEVAEYIHKQQLYKRSAGS